MFDLSGKMALVTGASGGIGGAIARAMHAQGAHVVLSGTREQALAELRQDLGDRASIAPADLSQSAPVDGLVAVAEAAAGMELDILVSNAGVAAVAARRYAVTTHERSSRSARLLPIAGKAGATMVCSSAERNIASMMPTRIVRMAA